MRAYRRFDKRGFTLVELMIVVAIIGVLAALAIYGVSRYLNSAKTAEAKNNVGGITRAAVAAFERETYQNDLLQPGTISDKPSHALCDSATLAPATFPKGAKVQPDTGDGKDFNTGDDVKGWKCLKFGISQPVQYQYNYEKGVGTGKSKAEATGFEASAAGDLDDDTIKSFFGRGAAVRDGEVVLSTTIFVENEFE